MRRVGVRATVTGVLLVGAKQGFSVWGDGRGFGYIRSEAGRVMAVFVGRNPIHAVIHKQLLNVLNGGLTKGHGVA